MTFATHLEKTAQAVSFLSRFPIPAYFFKNNHDTFTETSGYFVIAGFIISLPTCIIIMLLHAFSIAPTIIASVIIVWQTITTGALHEDGLSDSADGLWGANEKGVMLKIMEDSQLGTYGTLALIFAILFKFAAFSQLVAQFTIHEILWTIIMVNCLSRGVMVWHWHKLPCAKNNGITSMIGSPSENAMKLVMKTCVCIAIISVIFLELLAIGMAILIMIVINLYFTKLVKNKLGGHTGDTIGATQQVSEIVLLLTLALTI